MSSRRSAVARCVSLAVLALNIHLICCASSSSSKKASLRSHTDNALDDPFFVCASPSQVEAQIASSANNFMSCISAVNSSYSGGVPLGTTCTAQEGNARAPCAFPFIYNSSTEYLCTTASLGTPWCYTVPNAKQPCSAADLDAGTCTTLPQLPCQCAKAGVWNAPPVGGATITVIGSGFGKSSIPCDPAYLSCLQDAAYNKGDPNQASVLSALCLGKVYPLGNDPNKPNVDFGAGKNQYPSNCLFIKAGIGLTSARTQTWTSDTSISFILPPGFGSGHQLQVATGRFQRTTDDYRPRMLCDIFSYDAPAAAAVRRTNVAAVGGAPLTILGRNFAAQSVSLVAAVGATLCGGATWISDSSVICTVAPGTGRGLRVGLQITSPVVPAPHSPCTTTAAQPTFPCPACGVTLAFSYDRPSIRAVLPGNGPPAGYTMVATILGRNFGGVPPSNGNATDNNGTRPYALARFPDPGYYVELHNLTTYLGGTAGLEFVCVGGGNDGQACSCPTAVGGVCPPAVSARTCPGGSCRAERYVCVRSPTQPFIPCAGAIDIGTCNDDIGGPGRCNTVPLGRGCAYWDRLCRISPHLCHPLLLSVSCQRLPGEGYGCGPGAAAGLPRQNAALCGARPLFGAVVTGTQCVVLTWVSDSTLLCRMPPGLGMMQSIGVEVDGQSSTLTRAFSFDLPVVSALPPAALASSGNQRGTVYGVNFGVFQCNLTFCGYDAVRGRIRSHNAAVGDTACTSSQWISDSAIVCITAPGVGRAQLLLVSVYGNTSADGPTGASSIVDYQPPLVTAAMPPSGVAVGAQDVTIMGSSFGGSDYSLRARLIGTACTSTTWRSDSAVVCVSPRGLRPPSCSGVTSVEEAPVIEAACFASECRGQDAITVTRCRMVAVTVASQLGTAAGMYQYNAPILTKLEPKNVPCTGGRNITLMGQNFGSQAYYGHGAFINDPLVGVKPFSKTWWISDSSLICTTVASMGTDKSVRAEILFDPLTKTFILSTEATCQTIGVQAQGQCAPTLDYDRPTVQALEPSHLPAINGRTTTATGQNFGTRACWTGECSISGPPVMALGDTTCAQTVWTSDSSIRCDLKYATTLSVVQVNGVGQGLAVKVSAGGRLGTGDVPFSFDAPLVMGFAGGREIDAVFFANNGPARGGGSQIIFGKNFGGADYSPVAAIGKSDCTVTVWNSDTSLGCVVPQCTQFLGGANRGLDVAVRVSDLSRGSLSRQVGVKSEGYSFDPPLKTPFTLNNSEMNVLAFVGAAVVAVSVIAACSGGYARRVGGMISTKHSLAEMRARFPHKRRNLKRVPADDEAEKIANRAAKARLLGEEDDMLVSVHSDSDGPGDDDDSAGAGAGRRRGKGGSDDDDYDDSDSGSAGGGGGRRRRGGGGGEEEEDDFYEFEGGGLDATKSLHRAFKKGVRAGLRVDSLKDNAYTMESDTGSGLTDSEDDSDDYPSKPPPSAGPASGAPVGGRKGGFSLALNPGEVPLSTFTPPPAVQRPTKGGVHFLPAAQPATGLSGPLSESSGPRSGFPAAASSDTAPPPPQSAEPGGIRVQEVEWVPAGGGGRGGRGGGSSSGESESDSGSDVDSAAGWARAAPAARDLKAAAADTVTPTDGGAGGAGPVGKV